MFLTSGVVRFSLIKLCLLAFLFGHFPAWSLDFNLKDEFCSKSLNTFGPAYGLNLRQRTRDLVNHTEQLGLCEAFQLQEVWRESHREHLETKMLNRFGLMNSVFYDVTRSDNGQSGLKSLFPSGTVLLASSHIFTVNRKGLLDWFRKRLGVVKAYARASVYYPDRPLLSQVQHLNTHLHHSSQDIRLTQILQMAQEFTADQSFVQPWLASGDFNAVPKSLEWYLMTSVFGFKDSFTEAYENPDNPNPCTYCRGNPLSLDPFRSRRIDYIFYRSAYQIELHAANARVVFNQAPFVSDHFGVEAELNLSATDSYLVYQERFPQAEDFAQQSHILNTVIERLQSSRIRGVHRFVAPAKDLLQRFQNPSLEDPLIDFLWHQPGGLPYPADIDFVDDFFMGDFVDEEQL